MLFSLLRVAFLASITVISACGSNSSSSTSPGMGSGGGAILRENVQLPGVLFSMTKFAQLQAVKRVAR